MSWSYSGDPGSSNKDAVRFLIKDTNSARQLTLDEEIDFTLGQEANIYMAAAAICEGLVVQGGSVKSKKVGELSITYDPSFYRGLAGTLRARGSGHQVPYVGGISISDKEAQRADSDWVTPAINRGQGNNSQAPAAETPTINSTGNRLTDL